MRTTLDLPDDLIRSVKVRAAQTDRPLTETIAELLRTGLASSERLGTSSRRITLPLVSTPRTASAHDLSPQRISEILVDSDVENLA